ncbi:MAG: hypothetical protein V1494_06640 [Candidatus Diapherotrites archaeon]
MKKSLYSYSYNNIWGFILNTTIQVGKATVQVLNKLKEKYGVKSYDKVIQKIIQKEENVPKSLFGAHPELKPFKRLEEDFHEI